VPISTDYRGVTVWECPPNGQGLAALSALNIAEQFELGSFAAQSVERYHYLIEAMRLGFADALQYVADPTMHAVPVAALLDKRYAAQRASVIQAHQALSEVHFGNPFQGSDTVYVTAVDMEGNACSLINSTFQSFGSGLVVPGTGISLQNRGAGFSLDPAHPSCLAPNKRPYHTIIPGMATRGDDLWLSFGVMGAFQQPQGHLQVISNLVDYGMNPQQALDALRFSIELTSQVVRLEAGVSHQVSDGLQQRGHQVQLIEGWQRMEFGGGQIILRDAETGVLFAGSEPRKDGAAVGF
jgi:gamma-glutamyltranspeptidase/glutathione hydrolase